MPENKTKATRSSVAAFIETLTDDRRRADAKALVKLMQSVTSEKPKRRGPSIIGFGSYHYKDDSGREGDMPLVGFSPSKTATVLYNVGGFSGSKSLRFKLGKHTTGKGCVSLKKLADKEQETLKTMVLKSVEVRRVRYPHGRSRKLR